MVKIEISEWDEAICDMNACQHPTCWEAIQRIEKGQPRILLKSVKSLERHSPETEDKLPTLKIFNLPLNYSYKGRIKHLENSSSIINIKDNRNCPPDPPVFEAFVPDVPELSPERDNFPGLNSRMECPTPQDRPLQLTDLGQSTASKLAYQPAYRNLILRWIPDTRPRFLQCEKPPTKTCIPSQRMCVKDLALEILQSFKDSKETHFPKLEKRKKSNKVPTGGQPYLLHLRRKPKIPPNKSSSPTTKERKPVESPAGKRKFFPPYLQLSPLGEVQRKDAVHVENKKNALPGSKEMETYPLIVQKVPVNERGLRRIQSQLKLALEGPGSRVPKHPLATPAQRLNSTTSTSLTSEAHGQRRKGGHLPQEASAEKVPLPECSPWTSQVDIDRKKPSLKYVEYKSNTPSFFMEGYDSYIHQISETFKQYYQNLTIRKKAALTLKSESWIGETAQKLDNAVQSQSPPPPPPTPIPFEFSDNTQDHTCS